MKQKKFYSFVVILLMGAMYFLLATEGYAVDIATQKVEKKYYQAVAVLQELLEDAKAEGEVLPQGTFFVDAVESLLHHPDRTLVLQTLAEDFSELGKKVGKSQLYEAYIRLALGEKQKGVMLLMDYVASDVTCNPRHYRLIATNLVSLSNWLSLYIISREWAERGQPCLEERVTFEWIALMKLERYAEARQTAQAHEKCLGWKWCSYAATALFMSGAIEEACALLESAKYQYPNDVEALTTYYEDLLVDI